MGVRLSAPPASIPEHWILCQTARQFRAAVSGSGEVTDGLADGLLHTRKLVERRDGTSVDGEW